MITSEEYQDGLNTFDGWKYRAWMAFYQFNIIKEGYDQSSAKKKVIIQEFFYNCVYKCDETDSHYVTSDVVDLPRLPRGGYGKHTKDHPYTARVAGRAILEDNQWLLDNWEIFAEEFFKLTTVVGVTGDQNQDVKVVPDDFGGIIVKEVLQERYKNILWQYNYNDKIYSVSKFPLKAEPWYINYEIKKNEQWKDAGCNLDTYKKNLQVNDYGQTCI